MKQSMRFAGILFLLAIILGWEYIHYGPLHPDWLRELRDELFILLQTPWIQKTEVFCRAALVLGLITFLGLVERTSTARLRNSPLGWSLRILRAAYLWVFVSIGVLMYFTRSGEANGSGEPLAFLWGIFLSWGALMLMKEQSTPEGKLKTLETIVDALLVVIMFSSVFQTHWPDQYQYLGQTRWLGPWRTPNTFGLLMGVGVVLSSGQSLWRWKLWQRNAVTSSKQSPGWGRLRTVFYPIAAVLTGIGLVKSYSRGAWLGVGIGLSYFVLRSGIFSDIKRRLLRGGTSECQRFSVPLLILFKHRLLTGMVVTSLVVLMFWSCRFSDFQVVRRVCSVCNVNDFSWRNRLIAYEGALQMMAAQPWFGYGWERPKMVYDQFYRPPRLNQGVVIELNDYFMTGMMFGLPALACFVGYLALTLFPHSSPSASQESLRTCDGWLIGITPLRVCCRAGAIVLLVGFWIDRGLYWVVLSVPFWLLLELSATTVECLQPTRGLEGAEPPVAAVTQV